MANKKIRRISCSCKGNEMRKHEHFGRKCHCLIDTPKGTRSKHGFSHIQVTEADVDFIILGRT
jgi:hypothetical protein